MNSSGESLPFSTADWFRTPRGKGELVPVPEYRAAAESRGQNSGYPMEFLGRKATNYMNTTFANQGTHQKMEAAGRNVVEMHPDDAAARTVAEGDLVEIWNDRGRIVLRAKLSANVGRGVAAGWLDWTKYGDASGVHVNVNTLTGEGVADLGGGATF